MATKDGPPPLSLRPFPVADRQPSNLADFIARVNARPGGFRSLTEAKLREQIKVEENPDHDAEQEDVDMSDVADDEDAPASRDPNIARMEVLKNIDLASNTAMLTLDSLSLLLSKQNPTQAGLTLSQQLRDMVGIGTLGADKLDEPSANDAQTKAHEEVAVGWTLMEINKARNAAEAASLFLEREVDTESRYWEEVMSVKKAGWSMCRVPQERHTLGVRFGFSEAAAEFKNNGLAPMRRSEDGSIELDLGRLGGVSEGLVVTYEKDDKIVGRSVPWRRSPDDPLLESRVLESRNTIFSQELWHELTREARTLAAYDVRLQGSRLTCKVDESSKITIELLPLEACPSPDDSLAENGTTEMTLLSLHILLSYAHRYNELMRTRPIPPHVSRARGQQTYALLRPIIARLKSNISIRACTEYVGDLVGALQKAGLPSSFTLRTPQLSMIESGASGPNQQSGAQTLVRNMLQPLEFTVKVVILDDMSFTIRGRTLLFPFTATYYHVLLPPSSPLQSMAAPFADGYSELRTLSEYVQTAVARTLAMHNISRLSASSTNCEWALDIVGTAIQDAEANRSALHFAVRDVDSGSTIVLTSVPAGESGSNGGQKAWTWAKNGSGSESRTLEAVVDDFSRTVNL
ncbi:RNA polymerase II mediator complex subunit [Purpureocillium takamizusanense]|uniref:Mediator of RNA polymerase II transcription subunit 17 n=1 Tax=Purpureocillium takamizusanense TaxID=2060973 RepID=A0A9Q8Q6A7_9HYPO|nr:RNA polymerase II mediator complex subunit [Purpureocillium takamizusanense]UNI13795.1 RNA polymerase II mediator complex subunit [Purpureocillium takamizusanense]